MAKIAQKYLEVLPFGLKESGFHGDRSQVSESLFSLSNEYMGFRGFFDEGYSKDTLIGSYFNGIYEVPQNISHSHYKGISDKGHYMVNSTNVFYTRLYLNDQLFEFNPSSIHNFERSLDFKTGELVRSYDILNQVRITFKRMIDMVNVENVSQQIIIEPLDYTGKVKLDIGLDLSIKHWGNPNFWQIVKRQKRLIVGKTTTNQTILSTYQLSVDTSYQSKHQYKDKKQVETIEFVLDQTTTIEKNIINLCDKTKTQTPEQMMANIGNFSSYQEIKNSNQAFFDDAWQKIDIEIDGDLENQQGIRFCLFQLMQTYHGADETNNIGAKGLTGEAYSGHAFWDTETYCLPFYIFNNIKAARQLLLYRYHTLPQAKRRAGELDCGGACYPIATLNGDEACDLWQHASLQFQPTTAVAYGIWHYVKNSHDVAFLTHYGIEMLIEICRFLKDRGQYNQTKTKFGYYGVMGPDEFQMMVNHNAYTNLMAKKTFDFLIESLNTYGLDPYVKEVIRKTQFTTEELNDIKHKAEIMYIPYDQRTKLYEQHDGFFDLPHIDIDSIPVTDFPLYSHWSYDRIYRNDMIKQPDVLMFMFLHNQSFDLETKLRNYEFYEPKTIHESSLSPSIHSVLATEVGKSNEALNFFRFATRMDLDDYNRNTKEGLHTTSIAAAWVNIVYGFGGLRSDGPVLKLSPTCPAVWHKYSFKINYLGSLIEVTVTKDEVLIKTDKPLKEAILVYDQLVHIENTYMVKKHV